MDSLNSGYSRTVETDVYEYRSDGFLPIDALSQERTLCLPSSSDSDQLSMQGSGSQQSSLAQNFYRASSMQSSLTSSSSQGAGVSAVFLCQIENIDWLLA
jgi:hypothetical protein